MPKVSQLNEATKVALRAATGVYWVDVKQYGAVGDGVADDTAAIQAAINAAQHVHFSQGRYKVTASATAMVYGNTTIPIYRALDINKSGLRLTGEGAVIEQGRQSRPSPGD